MITAGPDADGVDRRDVVLATYVARWIHSAFGLRYLKANLGELESRSTILEFTSDASAADAAEAILLHRPRLVGLGVYIWNVREVTELVAVLKRVAPEVVIVLGGPEVSHELDDQPVVELADFVVTGEGDLTFPRLCEAILHGDAPAEKIVAGAPPAVEDLALPYRLYDDRDVAHRVIYVEASRGCPFRCEFCLSSLDRGVRSFDLEPFLDEMASLWDRGARQFKFVDRTFNLREETTVRILEFFLERAEHGAFAHFEMIPDRLPDGLRDVIAKFPAGTLQFEVGIQTFDPDVAKRISRRQNYEKLSDNLRFLRDETSVHVHADLIVGLPGETLETFGHGFDQLVELGPQEIQVGILKRLRGTPIVRWDEEFEVVWSPEPPYEILANRQFDFSRMQEMKRFARYWDLVANSGRFVTVLPALWTGRSPFREFFEFSNHLWDDIGRTHGISPMLLFEKIFRWSQARGIDPESIGPALAEDWARMGRHDVPRWLRPWREIAEQRAEPADGPARQSRFLTSVGG